MGRYSACPASLACCGLYGSQGINRIFRDDIGRRTPYIHMGLKELDIVFKVKNMGKVQKSVLPNPRGSGVLISED